MNLSQQILAVLGRIAPHGLTQSSLRDELRVRLGTRPGQQDTDAALYRLQQQGYIFKIVDEVTDDERWSITAEGAKK